MCSRIVAQGAASCFSTDGGMLSGPQALFGSRLLSSFCIPGAVKCTSSIPGCFCSCGEVWSIGVSCVNTDWNWLLRMFAFPTGSDTSWPVEWDRRCVLWEVVPQPNGAREKGMEVGVDRGLGDSILEVAVSSYSADRGEVIKR